MKRIFIIASVYIFSNCLSAQNISSQIENYISRAHELDRFSGAILVQKGEQELFKGAYGIARLEEGVKNTIDLKFNIGSITKQFTATAILKLQQEGKLELHQSINDYLGKFASDRWKGVSVHHLLSHQSGIPSILQSGQGLDHYWPKETQISWEEQISYFKHLKLINKPGEEYRYNNTGYILLALIVEQTSKMPYPKFIEEKILKPNGLHATTTSKKGEKVADNHYCYAPEEMEKAPEYHYSWYRGAGGNYTTVEDLNKWYNVIHNSDFLTQENRALLFKVHAKNYGYGWMVEKRRHQRIVHHDGTDFGSTSFFLTVPKEALRIIILTNQTHKELYNLGKSEAWVQQIGYDILDIVNGEEIAPLPRIVTDSSFGKNFNGRYIFEDGTTIVIYQEDGQFKLVTEHAEPSMYRFGFHQTVDGESTVIAATAIKASEALAKKKFWAFAKYCNWEMKSVSYTGLMAIGFNSILKPIGKIQKVVVYHTDEISAQTRFFGEEGSVDFTFYFDKAHKIKGVFDTGYANILQPDTIELIPIEGNKLLMDGFPKGEMDAVLELTNTGMKKQLIMTQGGRSFLATSIE